MTPTKTLAAYSVAIVACGVTPSADPSETGGSETTTPSGTASTSSSEGALDGSHGGGSGESTSDPTTAASTSSGAGETGAPDPDANPLFADLAPGHVLDLGPFDCTPPAGEEGCIGVTDYSGMDFDPQGHRVLAFGGGHATTMNDSVHALDLGGTPSWAPMYPPTPCEVMDAGNVDDALGAWASGPAGPYPRPIAAHTYDYVAFAPAQNELVLLGRKFTAGYCTNISNDIQGPIAHFDLAGGTWSFSGDDASWGFVPSLASAEFDPVSGLFVSLGVEGIVLYDPASRSVVGSVSSLPGIDVNEIGYVSHMTYFPPTDTFYYFRHDAAIDVFALRLDRGDLGASSLEFVPSQGPSPLHPEPGFDYDSVREVIGGAVFENTFHTFDPITATWTATVVQGGEPGTEAFHALVYDSVDDVFIFITDLASGGRTWAYRNG